MRYNSAKRELIFKIVYCGPGLAGKTTSLEFLHSRVPAGRASGLISIDTHSQRTLQFDFGSVELGRIQGIPTRLEFFTVPGQSYYAATRRNVLAGADGIVFVVDSRQVAIQENIAAMNEMLADLLFHRLPTDLPVVLQYNKQDLEDALPVNQLDPLLNTRGWKSFPTVATQGHGVVETCESLAEQLAERAASLSLPLPGEAESTNSAPQPSSWLITCHRCQSMLEVPTAAAGEIYECAVCKSPLEVVDPDRGLTRRPAAKTDLPATQEYQATSSPRGKDIPSGLFGREEPGSDGYPISISRPPTPGGSPNIISEEKTRFPLPGFHVLEVLDENPQGRRLRVREVETDRTYRALVVSPTLVAQPGFRALVEPFARRVGPIRHPNLLRMTSLRTTGEDGGQVVYLADDPADHEPLSHVLARRRALAPPHAIAILRQIALALEEASRHGSIHGWLRPEVILVDADGHVLVDELYLPADHAFLIESLAGHSAATEYYLAPEQFAEEVQADIGTDIFLLGALLFRMITGEGLVTGHSASEALQRLHQEGPRALRSAQQGLSRDLNNFYGKLVDLDRDQRYPGYRELLEALDRFGGGAKRQNVQLTARNTKRPANGPAARTTDRQVNTRSHRRPGSEQAAPLQHSGSPRHNAVDHSVSTNRTTRRRSGDSVLLVVIPVVICLILAVMITALILSRPRPQPIQDVPQIASRISDSPPAAPMVTGQVPAVTSGPIQSTVPAPEQVRSSDAPSPSTRQDLRRRIAESVGAHRWSQALALSEQLPDPLDRQESEAQIMRIHQGKREEVQQMLDQGGNPELIRKALGPFSGNQSLPGDGTWVAQMLARLETLGRPQPTDGNGPPQQPANTSRPIAASAPVVNIPDSPTGDWGPGRRLSLLEPLQVPVAGAPVTVPPSAGKTENIAAAADPELDAFTGVLRALTANQPSQAQRIISALPAGTATVPDMQGLLAIWPGRSKLINRVASTQGNRLRCLHPITDEVMDVIRADDAGVTLMSAKGGSSSLNWSQLPPANSAQLLLDAIAAPGRTSEEVSGAIAGLLAVQDPGSAGSLVKRDRALLGSQESLLDRQIELAWGVQALVRLNQGFDALRAGNRKDASAAVADLRRIDPRWRSRFAADLTRLEALTSAPVPGPSPVLVTVPGDVPPTALSPEIKNRQNLLRDLGWESIGDAILEGAAVRLPMNAGIATAIPSGTGGFTISASGEGYLRLIALRGPAQPGIKGGILLPLNPEKINAWTLLLIREKMTLMDVRGAVVQSLPLGPTPTTFVVLSTGNAVLASLPGPYIP